MKSFVQIVKRDLRSFFYSPIAYGLLSVFFCVAAYFFFNLLGSFNFAVLQEAQVPVGDIGRNLNLNEWVVQGYFHTLLLLLVLLVPLTTMGVFSEERQQGTLLLLATLPLGAASFFAGKLIARVTLICSMLLITFILPLALCYFSNPEVLPIITGMLGLFMVAIAFTSIGMCIAALVDNALVSGAITLAVLLTLYGIHMPAESLSSSSQIVLRYLSPLWQMRDLFRGVLTPAPFVLSISVFAASILIGREIVSLRVLKG